MKHFLSDQRRDELIHILQGMGIGNDLAIKLASEPDIIPIIDVKLTAHINQAAETKNKIDAGETDLGKFLAASILILCIYMQEVEERGLGEDDLPLVHEAFNHHNAIWADQKGTLQ